MYSRSQPSDERYRENLPPVYGGSRFYRGGVKTKGDERAAPPLPEEGIEVLYEARPIPERVPVDTESGSEETAAVLPLEKEKEEVAPAVTREKREGVLPALFQDPEEILLLALLFLLSAEGEHAVDVIVILLLLTVIR